MEPAGLGGSEVAGRTAGTHLYKAAENMVHIHELRATIMHLLGLDHEKLTYCYAGRNFRLTDVHGEAVKCVLA